MMHIQGIEDVKAKLTPEQKKETVPNDAKEENEHGKGHDGLATMMKGNMDMGPDTGAADAKPAKKIKLQKPFPPAHQHDQIIS